jgi:hypothetical protein
MRGKMRRQLYPDDMTDKEWELIRPFLEQNNSPKGENQNTQSAK